MQYLLDANMLRQLMQLRGNVAARIRELASADSVAICTITRGEVLYGIQIMPMGKRRQQLAEQAGLVLQRLVCRQIPNEAAERYAMIKSMRRSAGREMRENDLWIAATAMAIGAVLVSHDFDMQGIPGLIVEDWW